MSVLVRDVVFVRKDKEDKFLSIGIGKNGGFGGGFGGRGGAGGGGDLGGGAGGH